MNSGVGAWLLGMGLLMACPALRWGVHLLTVSDNHQGRALPIHVVSADCRDPAVEVGFPCKAELPSGMGTASYLPTLFLQDTCGGEDG